MRDEKIGSKVGQKPAFLPEFFLFCRLSSLSLSSLHRPGHHCHHHQIFSHWLHHRKETQPPSSHQEPPRLAFSLLYKFSSSLPSATTDRQLPYRSSQRRRLNYLLNLLITSVTITPSSLLLRLSAAFATVWLHAEHEQ